MRTAFRTQILLLFSWTLSCGAALRAAEVPGGEELKKLLPHLEATCAVVRENPAMWPYRSFPYGPLGLGISALVKETSATRAVGVGIGDNESGLLFLPSGTAVPKVGETRPGGNKYEIVEKVSANVFYYETS